MENTMSDTFYKDLSSKKEEINYCSIDEHIHYLHKKVINLNLLEKLIDYNATLSTN